MDYGVVILQCIRTGLSCCSGLLSRSGDRQADTAPVDIEAVLLAAMLSSDDQKLRFELERYGSEVMDHPVLSKLIDAGMSDNQWSRILCVLHYTSHVKHIDAQVLNELVDRLVDLNVNALGDIYRQCIAYLIDTGLSIDTRCFNGNYVINELLCTDNLGLVERFIKILGGYKQGSIPLISLASTAVLVMNDEMVDMLLKFGMSHTEIAQAAGEKSYYRYISMYEHHSIRSDMPVRIHADGAAISL